MKEKQSLKSKPVVEDYVDDRLGESRHLILHNDDVHTFDYVIDSLVEVCDMELLQAEQCTFLVHYKGKCDVKKGAFSVLKPFKEGLIEKGLNATID